MRVGRALCRAEVTYGWFAGLAVMAYSAEQSGRW